MLKGLDPLLSPDLLHMIASMGHGDELVIADANFPATNVARRLVRADGCSTTDVLTAILSLFPLDQYVKMPVAVMAVVGDPDAEVETYADFERTIRQAERRAVPMEKVERHAFYGRAREAFGIVATGERRLYGNIIIAKGVVAPKSRKPPQSRKTSRSRRA